MKLIVKTRWSQQESRDPSQLLSQGTSTGAGKNGREDRIDLYEAIRIAVQLAEPIGRTGQGLSEADARTVPDSAGASGSDADSPGKSTDPAVDRRQPVGNVSCRGRGEGPRDGPRLY